MLSPAKLPGGVDLVVKQGMARLNRVRVGLKHHGVQPGKAAIDQNLADAATFFAANTPLVFGIDYDQVSMADVIVVSSRVTDCRLVHGVAVAGVPAIATDAKRPIAAPTRHSRCIVCPP